MHPILSHPTANMLSPTAPETSPPPLPSLENGDTTVVSSSEKNMMSRDLENHVLMVSFSAQGHINPMLRLGKLLISKGLHLTLATTEVTRQRMQNSNNGPTKDSSSGVELVFFSDGMSLDYNRGANLDYFMDTINKAGPINLSALIKDRYPEGGQRKLLCLIANPFVPWVADVASELGIPSALLWIQPCSLYSIYYNFYIKSSEVHFPTEEDPEKSVEIPGLPLLTTQDLPSFVLPTNPFNSMSKVMLELFRISLPKFKWVLVNSFYELEKSVIDSIPHRVFPVGPLVPPLLLGQDKEEEEGSVVEMWKSDDSCIGWLDKQEPQSVIYVSFGSIIGLTSKQMEDIAMALKNSGRPFLWVAKLTEITSANGTGQVPLGFLDETKEQGHVVPWSPQTRVLNHSAIACFVTHCGWNSMLEAISSGVPLIAYPQWTDQPTNAKLVTDMFKNGVRLKKDDETGIVTSSEIQKCIEQVMVGDKAVELRKNAEELRRAAREALGPGGSSEKTTQQFVDDALSVKKHPVCHVSCVTKPSSDCVEEEGREDKILDGQNL